MTASAAVASRTRFTTVFGGVGIIAGGVLSLASTSTFLTVVTSAPFWFTAGHALASITVAVGQTVLAAAVYILAFGVRAETGLVGDSRTGKVAAVVFSSALILNVLVRLLFRALPPNLTYGSVGVSAYIPLGLDAVALICLIIAVIIVVQAGALNRVLRWGMVIVTAFTALTALLWFIPRAPVIFFIFAAQPIGIVLLIILGAAIALHGQSPALRRRAAIINEHW